MSREFNGSTDRIDWASIANLTGHAQTISFWVYLDTYVANGYILCIHDSGNTSFGEIINASSPSETGYIGLIVNGSTDLQRASPTGTITTGSWINIIVTWSGTFTDSSTVHIYKNGTEVSPYSTYTNGASETTHSGSWSLGGRIYDDNRMFDGKLAEVAVWDRVLSSGEMAALAAGATPDTYATNLVFYYSARTDTTTAETGGAAATVDGTSYFASHPLIKTTESTQAQTSDAASLSFSPAGGTVNITAAENTHTQTSDAASLAFGATYNITAAENIQAQTSDAASLSFTSVYTIDDIELEWIVQLAAAENTQAQTSDAASLTFTGPTYAITPAENNQGGISDPAIITFTGPTWAVTGTEGTQTHTSDPAVITFTGPTYPITPAENTQAQDSDAAVVTFGLVTSLTAAENTQSQTSDSAVIYAIYSLTGAENTHTQVSDAASITFTGIGETSITAAENSHAQDSDAALISVLHPLAGAENTQSQVSDAASLTFNGAEYGITGAENTQAQVSDSATIYAIYPVIGAENIQVQTSDAATIILAALILHGARRVHRPNTRATHRAPARVTLEVDDD